MNNIEHQQKMFLIKWATKLTQSRNETWAIRARDVGGHICALIANVTEKENRARKQLNLNFGEKKS